MIEKNNSPNPYQSPRDTQPDGPTTAAAVRIAKIGFPPGESECDFFTFGEFAELFEDKLHNAFVPFNIATIRADQTVGLEQCKARISGSIRRLTDYQLSPWNKIKKWLLPFLGYKYRPASFEIVGQIESSQHDTIPFRLYREFSRGGLAFERPQGEKINMVVGLESEAARVASLAMRRSAQLLPPGTTGPFWWVLVCVPLLVATASSGLVYLIQNSPDAIRNIRTGLTFIAAILIATALLPSWLYSDARAGYFYRITAAKSGWQLRAFPLIVGVLVASLAIASFIYGDE